MADKNFIVKNGLEVGGQEVVSSSGVVTSAALGGQTLASTDSPTFNNLTLTNDIAVGGDLNLTGDLNITGDVNSLSVTDLDVTDQTITLGAGQVESASGGSGIVVDGSGASILWDETNDEWDFNKNIKTTGTVNNMTISASGFTCPTSQNFVINSPNGFRVNIDSNNTGTQENFVVGNNQTDAAANNILFKINEAGKTSIGHGSANANLHVGNTVSQGSQSNPAIQIGGDVNYRLGMYTGNEDAIIENKNGDDGIAFRVKTAGEAMRIDGGTGNVGIGVSSPSTMLHMNGTGDMIRLESTNSGAGGAQIDMLHFSPSGANEDTMAAINMGGYYAGTTSAYFGAIRCMATDLSARHGRIEFLTRDDSAFNTGLTISHESNVGIGESSPSFTSLSGATSTKGLEIFNEGNDTAAALKIAACNNTGTPGQKTNFEIIHKGDALRTHLRHADSDVMVIGPDGDIHLNPNDGDFRLRGGSYGSLLDSNINNNSNLRFEAAVGLLYNTGRSNGQHQFEVNGAQKFAVTPDYIQQTMTGSDQYTIRSVSNGSGDPGISFVRAGQCGFGIAVRNATVDYADFQMQTGGGTVYGQEGEFRIYENGQINMGDMAGYNGGIGQQFTNTGGMYITRNSSSAGNESFIVNNTNTGNSIGILQYRLNNSPQGQYLVGSSSGITFAGSSDYRYKTNVNTLTTSSLDKISQLRLVSYNWNTDSGMPVDEPQIGVIAHEMNDVFPEFVDGEYDAVWTQEEVDAKGEAAEANAGDIKPQTVSLLNRDMMVHVLKALQELKTKNDALEARITELEG